MLVAFGISGFLADHIFNPLLMEPGFLSGTIGRIIGTGPERGSGLMIILSGTFLLLYSVLTAFKGRGSDTLSEAMVSGGQ